MIGRQLRVRRVLTLCVMLSWLALSAAAQDLPEGWSEESHGFDANPAYNLVFPDDHVLEIVLTLDGGAWEEETIAGRLELGSYGSVQFDGRTWPYVRIVVTDDDLTAWRQGLAAPNLLLVFDSSVSNGQSFYGFPELKFHSSGDDSSLVRTKIALDLLRDAGIPSPRAAFCRVRVEALGDMEFVGFYTAIEVPGAPMLDAQFDEKDGSLYRADGEASRLGVVDPDAFVPILLAQPAYHAPQPDALIAALHANHGNRQSWRMDLEAIFDVYEYIRGLAVRTVLGCNMGYGRTLDSVTLYWDPGDERFHWVFSNPLQLAPALAAYLINPSLSNVADEWPLIRLIADDPSYMGTYLGYVDDVLNSVLRVGPIHDRLRQAHALLEPFVFDPDVRPEERSFLVSSDHFVVGLEELLFAVEDRYAQAIEFLAEVGFRPSPIVISELHYNPSLVQGIDNNFEFVELFNKGYRTIDLSGYMFIEGLHFALPPRTVLSPGQCLLLTKRAETYRDAPCEVQQWDRGSLSNGGETLRLVNRDGVEVDSVRYDDVAPWPEAADTGGSSLEIIDPRLPNYTYANWRASDAIGGSPGWVSP
jgi:CotH protein/lamin tail-like protein